MKTKKSLFLSCLMVVATCCLLRPAWSASLSFDPESIAVGMGDTFDVGIWVNGLKNELAAFDFNILYDAQMLSFVDYSLGTGLGVDVDPLLEEGTEPWDLSGGDDGVGTLSLAELSWLIDFSSQTSSMLLATVTFSALSAGTASFSFDSVVLSDPNGDPINASQTAPVPEPATGLLFGMGIAGLAALQRRCRQQHS